MEFKAVKIFFPPRDRWTSPGSDSFGPPTGTHLASHHCDAGLSRNGRHFRHSWNAGRRQTKTSQSGFKQFLKYCTSGRVTEQNLITTRENFRRSTHKFSKSGSRPKILKVSEAEKIQSARGQTKIFKVLEAEPKNFKVLEAAKFQSI